MATESDDNFNNLIAEMEAEENGVKTVDKKDANETSEIEYAHEQIMEEEGLSKDDLPNDIRKMVITFERKMRMAKAKKAPEKTFLQIQNLSTLIADKILDYLESEEPKKMEDGGGMDDGGMDDGGTDFVEDGGVDLEDPIDDENFSDGGSVKTKEKGSIFGGILGGIFDY